MDTMNITIPIGNGEQAVFTIAFKKSDFFAVVDLVGTLTIENVMHQELFEVY